MPEAVSVFDIFKVGVGPSSSHAMGPWRAAQRFTRGCLEAGLLPCVVRVRVDLYGSLAKTGKGHGTDVAVMMGLMDEDPEVVDTRGIPATIATLRKTRTLLLRGAKSIRFDPLDDIVFHPRESLAFHPNGLRFTAELENGGNCQETYFSIGGGFIVKEGEVGVETSMVALPFPIEKASDLLRYCREQGLEAPDVVRRNEAAWRGEAESTARLEQIWKVMRDSVFRGCHAEGILPGGLNLVRRAAGMHRLLLEGPAVYRDTEEWMEAIVRKRGSFSDILKWVSCFAIAVNEENAAFGRVVTAPTNGAAGVIPAVLMYYACFCQPKEGAIADFLLTAGEIGSLFKKGATLSAAMGGCQAEIGVSSAMAAAGLTQVQGGTIEKVMMAAEIAMEHHLGLTCDPVGGLVQIPCIERNAMGAIKAIAASNLALAGEPSNAKVSLDAVIESMWETAKDMSTKYKETAEGGLAARLPVNLAEC